MPGTARKRLIAALAVAATLLAGCGGAQQASLTKEHIRVERYTLHSRYVHQDLQVMRIVPAQHGNWTFVDLHGAMGGTLGPPGKPFLDGLRALGEKAPIVLIPGGGDLSYWHDRADGAWGSMVLKEIVPKHGRVALGGVSMGGYGALLLGAQGHFCAIAAHSPAIWESAADRPDGTFDNAADYRRNDIFHHPRSYTAPVWIDVGYGDPLRNADVIYANKIHAEIHLWPGSHDTDYWYAHEAEYFAWYAAHCAA